MKKVHAPQPLAYYISILSAQLGQCARLSRGLLYRAHLRVKIWVQSGVPTNPRWGKVYSLSTLCSFSRDRAPAPSSLSSAPALIPNPYTSSRDRAPASSSESSALALIPDPWTSSRDRAPASSSGSGAPALSPEP